VRVDVCASQREIHPAGVVCMVTGECAHICLCLLCCCCLAVRARCPVESNSLNFFDIITCRITHVCQVLLFVKRRIPPPPPPPPLHARTTRTEGRANVHFYSDRTHGPWLKIQVSSFCVCYLHRKHAYIMGCFWSVNPDTSPPCVVHTSNDRRR